ncbi:hypothetical protein Tco_0805141, partial [Tanacetum coccineum]
CLNHGSRYQVRNKSIYPHFVNVIPSLKGLVTEYISEEDSMLRLFDDHAVDERDIFKESLIAFQIIDFDLRLKLHVFPLSS